MVDRSAARLMGRVFKSLAEHEDTTRELVWAVACDSPDFSHDQMDCDGDLLALGLAKTGVHPSWPDEEPGTLYANEDGVTIEEAPPKPDPAAAVAVSVPKYRPGFDFNDEPIDNPGAPFP